MPRIILLLIASGMFVSTFAQIEISKKDNAGSLEKWVMTPLPTMKGVLGRLDINFPVGVERNILIHQQADNKFLTSVSYNDKIYNIAPGVYRFVLSSVPVENVPIQKGHETRLKAGFLDIVSEGDWHLYNNKKDKAYTSGNKPKKLPLPIGNYQIKLGGQFYPVIIKDGETVEDYSQEGIKEIGNIANDNINEEFFLIDAEHYTMVRIEENQELATGRLATKFPLAYEPLFFPEFTPLSIYRHGEETSRIYACDISHDGIPCKANYPLPDGNYDIRFGGGPVSQFDSTRPIIVSNVPVRKGYETRLKVGYIRFAANGLYKIKNESGQIWYKQYNIQGPGSYPLPIANYRVKQLYVGEFKMQMKDGKVSVLNPIDSAAVHKNLWSSKPVMVITEKNKLDPKFGRLNTYFANATKLGKFAIQLPNPNSSGYIVKRLDSLEFYDLLPGSYRVYLNNTPIDLLIESGKETTIKFGYIFFKTSEGFQIHNTVNNSSTSGIGGHKLALPIGFYRIVKNQKSYLIKINEGEMLQYPDTFYTYSF